MMVAKAIHLECEENLRTWPTDFIVTQDFHKRDKEKEKVVEEEVRQTQSQTLQIWPVTWQWSHVKNLNYFLKYGHFYLFLEVHFSKLS